MKHHQTEEGDKGAPLEGRRGRKVAPQRRIGNNATLPKEGGGKAAPKQPWDNYNYNYNYIFKL